MNTEEIPLAITVVSQVKDMGPWVGIVEVKGKEVYRTWEDYDHPAAALKRCARWVVVEDPLNTGEPDDPRDYEPDIRKEIEEASPCRFGGMREEQE